MVGADPVLREIAGRAPRHATRTDPGVGGSLSWETLRNRVPFGNKVRMDVMEAEGRNVTSSRWRVKN